jgi:hypothetical protein
MFNRNSSIVHTLALSFLVLTQALLADVSTNPPPVPPRRPRGIYAVVIVDEYIGHYKPSDLNKYFNQLFGDLLNNPAVSGIQLSVTWARLNPNPLTNAKPYDWDLIDDVFTAVANWNSANPTKPPKTVQLGVPAGFNSPQWVLDQLYSCDFLFSEALPIPPFGTTCGKATFSGFAEGGGTRELPMPWNPTYKSAWQTFLTALAARYELKPGFVSIGVGGPTASSTEMILPTTRSTAGTAQIGGLTPEEMWEKLLAYQYSDPSYQQSDQAFIDEWKNTIDMYGKTFSGVTLIASTGNGLPNLTICVLSSKTPSCTFTMPVDLTTDFSKICLTANMDCAAETTILSYFDQSTVGGPNAKAIQSSGMKAADPSKFNLGVSGAKWVSESTDLFTSPSQQILAGGQFDKSFSEFPVKEGSSSVREQAAFNVLKWYFDGTAVGSFFSASTGSAPLNYLQIYGPDIIYATNHATGPKVAVTEGSTTVKTTAQDLLDLASEKLAQIAEPALP